MMLPKTISNIFLSTITLFLLLSRTYVASGLNRRKPNILVILADDVGTGDVPLYWKGNYTSVNMPNLKKLMKKKGILFTDAHATPLCAPSRYSLLSGNYPHRGRRIFGSWSFNFHASQFTDDQVSLPKLLKKNGYRTGAFGKWHLGATAPPNGFPFNWADPSVLKDIITNELFDWSLPIKQAARYVGFDKSYTSMAGIQAPPYSFFQDDFLQTKEDQLNFWNIGRYQMSHGTSEIIEKGQGEKLWDSSAFDMIVVNKTKSFIGQHLKQYPYRPFFAYAALSNLHLPLTPPDKYLDGTKVKGRYDHEHLDLMHHLDKIVGSLVNFIQWKKIAKDTIIIFASDNGGRIYEVPNRYHANGPLRGSKSAVYEGGHRIPLIIRWDGVFPKNKKRNKMVHLTDIYATLSEIINATIPIGSAHDSVSFYDYAKSGRSSHKNRKDLYVDKLNQENQPDGLSFRRGNLKLIYEPQLDTIQCYDLRKDLREKENLIPKMIKTEKGITKLRNMFKQMMSLSPCPCSYSKGGARNPSECGTKYYSHCVKRNYHGYNHSMPLLKTLGL